MKDLHVHSVSNEDQDNTAEAACQFIRQFFDQVNDAMVHTLQQHLDALEVTLPDNLEKQVVLSQMKLCINQWYNYREDFEVSTFWELIQALCDGYDRSPAKFDIQEIYQSLLKIQAAQLNQAGRTGILYRWSQIHIKPYPKSRTLRYAQFSKLRNTQLMAECIGESWQS